MQLSFIKKLFLIITLVLITYFYAAWEKSKYTSYEDVTTSSLVLKDLPNLQIYTLESKKIFINLDTARNSGGVFIHLWGTWCAPCEREMPEFLSYADKVKNKGIKFYLIAVGDEIINVKKFLRKFPIIPENVTIAIDLDNNIMDLFGTLKVPETFLFNSSGKHVNKFVGPQEWSQPSYYSRLDGWLSPKNQ
jgi:thiol-disulfide isomerase/thioredoxin